MTTDTPTAEEMVLTIFSDPVYFGRSQLRHKYWSAQKRIMRSVLKSRRTWVKGCNGSGKAFAAADAAIWWLNRYQDGVVITTSPSDTQLGHVMWRYLKANIKQLKPRTWRVIQKAIYITEDNYILGFTTNESERFSGWHGRVLIIIDEAPGVEQFIWEAIQGIEAAGDVHILALGNPTIAGGTFYQAFAQPRLSESVITIDAFDTPNLRNLTFDDLEAMSDAELDANPWPQLTKRRWVLDMYREHGEASPIWQARVRGRFPEQSASSLYPLAWLEAAQQPAGDPGGPVVAGIDVAGAGDDETALCIRCDDVILVELAWTEADPRGQVVAALQPWNERLVAVQVDETGIGYNFKLHLADVFGAQRVTGINVGTASVDPARWLNYKAEVYWAFRERLQRGGVRNWRDRESFGQAAAVRHSIDSHGRTVIESKAEVKRRGLKSPDRFEAKLLAFVEPRALLANGGLRTGKARDMRVR